MYIYIYKQTHGYKNTCTYVFITVIVLTDAEKIYLCCSPDVAILLVEVLASSLHYASSWQDERLFGNWAECDYMYVSLLFQLFSYDITDEFGETRPQRPWSVSIDDYR